MKRVMKCRSCKIRLPYVGTGRRPIYCSAACRQKAYRKRRSENPEPLRLLKNDLFNMKDKCARIKGAIKVLEELGYAVHLERAGDVSEKSVASKSRLQLVDSPPYDGPEVSPDG